MTVAIAGACAGFSRTTSIPLDHHGRYRAMFLGFTLGAISVEGALKGVDLAFVVPILALGLPIFDTLFAIARRFVNGKPIYMRDGDHFHHRLLGLGSQRQAVLILYGLSAIMGGGAILALARRKPRQVSLCSRPSPWAPPLCPSNRRSPRF